MARLLVTGPPTAAQSGHVTCNHVTGNKNKKIRGTECGFSIQPPPSRSDNCTMRKRPQEIDRNAGRFFPRQDAVPPLLGGKTTNTKQFCDLLPVDLNTLDWGYLSVPAYRAWLEIRKDGKTTQQLIVTISHALVARNQSIAVVLRAAADNDSQSAAPPTPVELNSGAFKRCSPVCWY